MSYLFVNSVLNKAWSSVELMYFKLLGHCYRNKNHQQTRISSRRHVFDVCFWSVRSSYVEDQCSLEDRTDVRCTQIFVAMEMSSRILRHFLRLEKTRRAAFLHFCCPCSFHSPAASPPWSGMQLEKPFVFPTFVDKPTDLVTSFARDTFDCSSPKLEASKSVSPAWLRSVSQCPDVNSTARHRHIGPSQESGQARS
uniref:Uncharacterized protein n=1 Tax=Schistocephalus solidus TaxID=70667 RepID=A0A0X3PWA4_SCHSO